MINYKSELKKIIDYPVTPNDLSRSVADSGVALYGAGKMGKMAVDLMRSAGIKPKYIIDRNVTGDIDGIDIIPPHSIPAPDKQSATFAICIVTAPVQPIINFLLGLGCIDVRPFYAYSEKAFPHIMPNGWEMSTLDKADLTEVEQVLQALAHDEQSVIDYLRMLWWRLRRVDMTYPGYAVLAEQKYFKAPSFPDVGMKEVYVDGGAHFGTIIQDFLSVASSGYRQIHAFEPDLANLKVLHNNLPEDQDRITVYEEALSDCIGMVRFNDGLGYASSRNESGAQKVKTTTLDSIQQLAPTIIKLHIEGDELKALNGARLVILNYRPILMVLADHSRDGLYRIPKFLYELNNYRLYFNLHDYCGNTSIFYAYPNERLSIHA
ncbi:MAG: FkbM family methyltransferase [Pelodictyon phaeoclathratiforme]